MITMQDTIMYMIITYNEIKYMVRNQYFIAQKILRMFKNTNKFKSNQITN